LLLDMFGQMKRQGVRNLVIDVRSNPGGDGAPGIDLFRFLAKEPFTLFGPTTVKVSAEAKAIQGETEYVKNYSQQAWQAPNGTLLQQPVVKSWLTDPVEPELRFHGRCYVLCGHGTG